MYLTSNVQLFKVGSFFSFFLGQSGGGGLQTPIFNSYEKKNNSFKVYKTSSMDWYKYKHYTLKIGINLGTKLPKVTYI